MDLDKKKLFELHFIILNIFLSFSPSPATNFFSKIMFKTKAWLFTFKRPWLILKGKSQAFVLNIILEKKLAAGLGEKLKNMFKIIKWSSNNFFLSKTIAFSVNPMKKRFQDVHKNIDLDNFCRSYGELSISVRGKRLKIRALVYWQPVVLETFS